MNNNKNHTLDLTFCHAWRPEQQRVLDQLGGYLDDKRIHIVAAPGAGKTVIGLEIFNRLQLKTLTVAPTTIVRNQWLERLNKFLPDEQYNPSWAGTSLKHPLTFTASTYQGLFSFDKKLSGAKEDDIDAQYESLSHWFIEHEIRLLILDEAHHLRAAWWKVLMKLVNTSSDLIIVSLTATPPYDANAMEWSRYQQLCGSVDEEISIPELVRSNSLCPHQDYIWLVKTDDKNISSLNRQQNNLKKFIKSLETHTELLYLLSLHHWLDVERKPSHKDILVNLDECFALLGLFKLQQEPLPLHLLNILEIKAENIQSITVFGWGILLQSFLDGLHYPVAKPITAFKETLATLLKSKYFLKYNRVSLDNTKKKLDAFNKTQERIKACFDIASVEYRFRESWMRLVILSDYIRDEKYQLRLDGLEAPTGAYPIFHYFIHHLEPELAKKTVLFTGRLSIIHQDLLATLSDYLPPKLSLSIVPYSEQTDFVELKIASEHLSSAFTALHKDGDLQILIGTRSLLGEGWDAPHVNALILATQTGAYVTTNQIRGRAIRIDPEDDLKTASIWHIVAVAPDLPCNKLILHDLHKRFKTFAGIHASELRIESGIERLSLSVDDFGRTGGALDRASKDIIEQSNQATIQRLQDDIYNLQARWQNALEKVENHVFQAGLQINIKTDDQVSRYVAKLEKSNIEKLRQKINTKNLMITAGFGAVAIFSPFALIGLLHINTLGALLFGGSNLLAANVLRTKITENSFADAVVDKAHYPLKFAQLLLASLQEISLIQRKANNSNGVKVSELKVGYFRFSLNEFTRKENDIFLTALSQLLEPIQQPRYIIALNNKPNADEIFPVPHQLGRKKIYAEAFLLLWKKYLPEFPSSQLFLTSSEQGRVYLLKAKAATYKEQMQTDIRLIDRWE